MYGAKCGSHGSHTQPGVDSYTGAQSARFGPDSARFRRGFALTTGGHRRDAPGVGGGGSGRGARCRLQPASSPQTRRKPGGRMGGSRTGLRTALRGAGAVSAEREPHPGRTHGEAHECSTSGEIHRNTAIRLGTAPVCVPSDTPDHATESLSSHDQGVPERSSVYSWFCIRNTRQSVHTRTRLTPNRLSHTRVGMVAGGQPVNQQYPKPTTKPPSAKTIEKWCRDGIARATDGCKTEPDGDCPHGHPSWLIRLGIM